MLLTQTHIKHLTRAFNMKRPNINHIHIAIYNQRTYATMTTSFSDPPVSPAEQNEA